MHPYQNLEAKAFWSKAVAGRNFHEISELWDPKWKIESHDQIATFGSCFAQHIGNALQANGYSWLDAEAAPDRMSEKLSRKFNYGVFSSRTGNIYTTSLLRQWTEWSLGLSTPPEEVWISNDRVYDPFRPAIEPDGFETKEEMIASRQVTLEGFRKCIERSTNFVFTLGLTESWFSKAGGHEYPMCPGTTAGVFDRNDHIFINQGYSKVIENLKISMDLMRTVNADIKFLLTVSPVPLTATKSGQHVLPATVHSKSVLRAVAGELAESIAHVDYFPSYEIIASPPFRGSFYEPNQRGVVQTGVQHVMSQFFNCLYDKYPELLNDKAVQKKGLDVTTSSQAAVCEEEILGAFSTERH